MSLRSYLIDLGDGCRLRVDFELHTNIVTKLLVQLEIYNLDEWLAIVRYDTAHGYFHKDFRNPDGSYQKEEPVEIFQSYNDALNFAKSDLSLNWFSYKEKYLNSSELWKLRTYRRKSKRHLK